MKFISKEKKCIFGSIFCTVLTSLETLYPNWLDKARSSRFGSSMLWCPSLFPCCCDKNPDQTCLGRKDSVQLTECISSLSNSGLGFQAENLKVGTETVTIEQHCILYWHTSPGLLNYLSYKTHVYLPVDSTTYSGIGLAP